MLTTRSDEVCMKDDESFNEFYAKLNDIVNSSFNLGERISETEIVRKVLRYLPEIFNPKVIAVEKSNDLDMVKIEELVWSLQTYKLSLAEYKKNISLAPNNIKERISEKTDNDTQKNEKDAYFPKKLKIFFRNNKKSSGNFKDDSN